MECEVDQKPLASKDEGVAEFYINLPTLHKWNICLLYDVFIPKVCQANITIFTSRMKQK